MRSKPRCLPLTVFYCWDKWVIFDWILVTKLTFSLQVDSRCSRDSRSSRGPRRWGGSSSSGPKPDEQQTTPADTGTGGRGEDCSSLRANGKRIRDADGCFHPSGGRHHACECGQSPGERSEAVGAGRPRRRPAGRSLAVREQRCQTQEQVLVEKLQGGCDTRRFFHVSFPSPHILPSGWFLAADSVASDFWVETTIKVFFFLFFFIDLHASNSKHNITEIMITTQLK